MIYIIHTYCDISEHYKTHSVWEVDSLSVEEDYKSYMVGVAGENFKIVISQHWLDIGEWTLHNWHLSAAEYKKTEKAWNKYLKEHNVEWYIEEVLKGKRLEYKNILN